MPLSRDGDITGRADPFPKSVTPERIRENIDIFDFELSATDVEDITVLNKNERTGPDPDKFDGR